MDDTRQFKKGDIIRVTGEKLVAGSSKRTANALIMEAIGNNNAGGCDYIVCEIVHNAIFDPKNDIPVENIAPASVRHGDPIVKTQCIHVFSIEADSGAEKIGEISDKKFHEARNKVEKNLYVNATEDMLIGDSSEVVFTNGAGCKGRPVLILGESGSYTHVCSLTSKDYKAPGKIPIEQTSKTNLLHRNACFVHIQWMTSVPTRSVSVHGALERDDQKAVAAGLRERYGNVMTVIEKKPAIVRQMPPGTPTASASSPAHQPEKPPQTFKACRTGINMKEGVSTRAEAADVVARYYTQICALVRHEIIQKKMYSLLSSHGADPQDFLAMAMQSFMAPESKSDVPNTVGGVFSYMTAAAVNRARDVGRKIARSQLARDFRPLDEIDESEYLHADTSPASKLSAEEKSARVFDRARRIAASNPKMRDALASIEAQVVEGPDAEDLLWSESVSGQYRAPAGKLAEFAGMSPARFARHRKSLAKSLEVSLRHDQEFEPGEVSLREKSKPAREEVRYLTPSV